LTISDDGGFDELDVFSKRLIFQAGDFIAKLNYKLVKFFNLPLLPSNNDILVVHSSLCNISAPIAQSDYSDNLKVFS